MTSYGQDASTKDYTIMTDDQEDALSKAGLPSRELAFIFFIDADGKIKTFLPSGTDPAKVKDITGIDYSRQNPLRRDADIHMAASIHYLLAETRGANSAVCYWWTPSRCYCCGA